MNNQRQLKILLIQPPVEDFYFTPHRSSTLGLKTLAKVWTERGHNCQVLNCTMEKPLKKQISLPESLSYLNPYLVKLDKDMQSTSWFTRYYRFGPSIESCVEEIIKTKPDVVAVSAFAWSYADNTRKLLERLKAIRQKQSVSFLLVTGGPGVTVMPEYFTTFADLIVTGEGEDSIFEIENMVGAIDYPNKGLIINPGFTGELPFVYNLKSRKNSRFTVSTIISRGCPKKCSFCANHLVFGRLLRKVPLAVLKNGMDSIIDEILIVSEKQETIKLHINFEDDNILFYKEYFLEILVYVKYKCETNNIDFSFTTENGMDYTLLDNKLLGKFKELNIAQLNLSMASMDNNQLKEQKRSGNLKKLESILENSAELNIPAITYFICGLSGDTVTTIVNTLIYLHSLKTSIGISHYYPVPGLEDWQNKDIFLENTQALCRGSSAFPWNNSLNTNELITAFRLARTSNFIKYSKADKQKIKKIRNNLFEDFTINKKMVSLFFSQLTN